MSFFCRPVIYLPAASQWDYSPRSQVTRTHRRNLRRHPYSTQLGRHLFEYLLDDNSFDEIYDDADLPSSYVNIKPRRVWINKKKVPIKTPEKAVRYVEEQKNSKNDDGFLMDLDQLVGCLFSTIYGAQSELKSQSNPYRTKSAKIEDHLEGTKRIKQTSEKKPSKIQSTTNLSKQPITEQISSNRKLDEVEIKNNTKEKKSDQSTQNEEKVKSTVQPVREKPDDVQVIFVVDGNPCEEGTANVNGMDCSRNMCQPEEMEEEHHTEMDHPDQGEESKELTEIQGTETSNVDDNNEQTNSEDFGNTQIMELEDSEKFQATFDLSSFLPEEIQVKLSEDKLVLDAEHEVTKEGLIERHSVRKVMTLPSGVDPDSLRCRLADDGHMTITANHIGKNYKILKIEKQTD
ncbi:hypothetical protein LSH36_1201g00046 [Paralvinella palmiformis]|uniref:SHSP domain-containing protein n=1 Tax=Paralvinella palmiformis TaxID=53620 RepID=A0AAD9MPT3_9ANNE|nr:hypothetical protein LSH36_1201g00046 [Paralvinella palmiformis]